MQRKETPLERTELLIGSGGLDTLKNSRVAVFGIGGVGGYVVEALARAGIGTLDLIDMDTVSVSNLNRQIIATVKTVGRSKVEAAAERVADIAPDCVVHQHPVFFLPETQDQFDFTRYDYVVDAIDTVTGKLAIIEKAREAGVPVISSMGTGNKLDPSRFRVADIYETSVCPLARVMRKECRKRGIPALKVVFSTEEPLVPGNSVGEQDAENRGDAAQNAVAQASVEAQAAAEPQVAGAQSAAAPPKGRRAVPGSISFVPPAAGLILAGEVVRDLLRRG